MAAVIERFMTKDGSLQVASVVCTEVIEEARKIHDTFPIASAALGRALTGAGLLASFLKDSSRLALHFKGDGPLGPVFAEGTSDGHVRGFVVNPHIHLPSKNGKLNVGAGVGKGLLSVAKSAPHDKQPYTGSVEIQTGEIGEDIAFYLFQSQQIPSVVALGVFVEADNSVSAAGGAILQAMPGVTEATLEKLEKRVSKMRSITDMIRGGALARDLAFEILEDFEFQKLDQTLNLTYQCQCSTARVEKALLLVGAEEIKALIEKNTPAEVLCDFCGRKYFVEQTILSQLYEVARSRSFDA